MSTHQLFIDADDTLWENNIYFEEAFDRFLDILNHSHLSPLEIRDVLDDIERQNILVNGYGALNFGRNLVECYKHLAEQRFTESELRSIRELAEEILRKPVNVLDGVEETLAYLKERYPLTLLSKGDTSEQAGKLERSGLAQYFQHCRIVREKNPETYRTALAELGAEAEHCWMIGNSPKSDINPAIEAGLGAVFIPHTITWSLEHEELPEPGERFRVAERFSDLRSIF
jgi:putative hydrolase of the HAD superfamily